MKKRFITISFMFCLSVFFIGCVTTLKDYKPKSSAEEAIKVVLVMYENEWNKHNEAGVLALFNDRAKVMYGRERHIASKKEYVDILPERIAANPARLRFTTALSPLMLILGALNFYKIEIKFIDQNFDKKLILSLVKDKECKELVST